MGRTCKELWKNFHFVLKMIVFNTLLGIHFFFFDVYAACHQLYAFGNGYFYTTLINMIIILYAYVWFSTTFIWECCMIIVTVLMLTISTFSLIYDYYDDDGASDIYIDKHTQHEGRSFAISLGLATISIVILIIDLVLLIIKTGKGGAGNGRLRRGGGATHARTAEIAE